MAPRGSTLRVEDFEKFMLIIAKADRATKKALRDEVRQAGTAVRDDAKGKFDRYDPKSAAGYRVVVRQRGVAVEQKYRKTTGQHPKFGTLQMTKALLPALDENTDNTTRAVNAALDRIAARFNDD
jgi:hypothetical protein